MSTVRDAAVQLEAALKLVPNAGKSVSRDPASFNPPALVMGAPSLMYEAFCRTPTAARWIVFVVVEADGYAIEKLWDLVVAVGEAIDEHTDATVVRADPSAFPAGTTELPAYEVIVEFPLEE